MIPKEFFLQDLFSFQGRLSPRTFVRQYPSILAACFILLFIILINMIRAIDAVWISLLFSINFSSVVASPVIHRRLHDLEKSGRQQYIYLIFMISPLVFAINTYLLKFGINLYFSKEISVAVEIYGLISVIMYFVYLLFVLYLAFKRGTVGPNKYGPDPLHTDFIDHINHGHLS